MGGIPIDTQTRNIIINSSLAFNNTSYFPYNNLFISNSIKFNNYGGCSLTVEYATVARVKRVRLPPSAFRILQSNIISNDGIECESRFDSLQSAPAIEVYKNLKRFLRPLSAFWESNSLFLGGSI